MRVLIFLVLVLGLGGWAGVDYVRSGKLEQFLDAHPAAVHNTSVEYYWAVALRYTDHPESAMYRYRRVIQKYPDTSYAPLAWVDMIDMLDDHNDRDGVIREAAQFLAAYPDHPKAAYVRKKVSFLQNGI